MKYEWQIYTIVPHGLGEKIAALTREAGARGGTVLVGRGEVKSPILRALALADEERDVLITLAGEGELAPIMGAIQNAASKNGGKIIKRGESFVVPMGGTCMTRESDYEMITVIVNRGFADDIMHAARKAGAKGGTIINARGTGKPDDEKFFGITIVPEKEELIILAERADVPGIQAAIEGLSCLTEPGIGILFVTPVAKFISLGGKA